MKRLFMPILAVCLMFGLTAFAQETGKTDNMGNMGKTDTGKSSMSAPLKTLKGTVKAEGDKITFVNDADQKAWDVINPDTLKAHEGHHVQITAHVYADKDSIHVMSVKMLKPEKEKSPM